MLLLQVKGRPRSWWELDEAALFRIQNVAVSVSTHDLHLHVKQNKNKCGKYKTTSYQFRTHALI